MKFVLVLDLGGGGRSKRKVVPSGSALQTPETQRWLAVTCFNVKFSRGKAGGFVCACVYTKIRCSALMRLNFKSLKSQAELSKFKGTSHQPLKNIKPE